MTKTTYVLSLDGGGVRGIFSAAFLQVLEEYLIERKVCKDKLQEVFSLFVGTSTGAIIAACLATGDYNGREMCTKVYTNANAKKIFRKRIWNFNMVLMANPHWQGNLGTQGYVLTCLTHMAWPFMP